MQIIFPSLTMNPTFCTSYQEPTQKAQTSAKNVQQATHNDLLTGGNKAYQAALEKADTVTKQWKKCAQTIVAQKATMPKKRPSHSLGGSSQMKQVKKAKKSCRDRELIE
jgi:hypothetical protein